MTDCLKAKNQKKVVAKEKAQKWKQLPAGILKINIDGAVRESSKSGGWGFTIQNDQGALLAAGAGNLEHVANPLHAEALALQQAIIIAAQMGCQTVMFETDSMILKQAISSEEYDLSELGTLFREINFQMRVGLNVVHT